MYRMFTIALLMWKEVAKFEAVTDSMVFIAKKEQQGESGNCTMN